MAAVTFKCPNCAGPLKWDPENQNYKCDYCRASFTDEELTALHPEESQAVTDESHVKVYNCPSCGAQLVTDNTTAATTCYYCHNPIVLSDKVSGSLMPDYIVPFEIDRDKAKEIFSDWVAKHKYVPGAFYSASQIELLSGVYFPYWVYSCNLSGTVRGKGVRQRSWVQAGNKYTESSVFDISQDGEMEVKNVSRIALGKASKVLCESVMPFDHSKLRPFGIPYLQGYVAENRDIEKEELETAVRQEVTDHARTSLRNDVSSGFSSAEFEVLRTDIEQEDWKYALMPVWTLTYKDRSGKMYYFSINGQSGKTCGELPTDEGGLRKLFLKIFIPVLAGLLILFRFL